MKVLIIVLSYQDNGIYSKFYKAQKDTWGSIHLDGVETYYLLGNHHCNEIINDEILTNFNYSYANCGNRTIKAFELTNHIEYDYIFRTNSSSYIDKELLIKHLENKPKNKFYSGAIGNHNGILFASGCGFFISKDLVKLVLDNKDIFEHNIMDDVDLGNFLITHKVDIVDSERFDLVYSDNFDINLIPNNYFHYRLKNDNRDIDIENMYNIFKNKIK